MTAKACSLVRMLLGWHLALLAREPQQSMAATSTCKTRKLLLVLFSVALPSCGCNKAAPYREVARERAATMKEMAEILGTVQDADSMKQARREIEKLASREAALSVRARALPAPSARVVEEMAAEAALLQEALRQVQKESERIAKLPGGPDFLKELQQPPIIIKGPS